MNQTWEMVDRFLTDNSTDILHQQASDVIWVPYHKLHVGDNVNVHYDTMRLKVLSKEITYFSAIQGKWLSNRVTLSKVRNKSID